MIKLKKITSILLVFISIACNQGADDGFIEFFSKTQINPINSTTINLADEEGSDLFFSYLYSMTYVDGMLILNDPSTNYNLKILDLKTNKLRNFAKKGKGPNEMNSSQCEFSIDYINKKIYVTDRIKYHVYEVDSIKNEVDIPSYFVDIKANIKEDSFLSTSFCNGNYIIGSTFKKRFGLYNIKDETFVQNYNYEIGPMVNQAHFYNHPSEDKVAFFQSIYIASGILNLDRNEISMKETVWFKSKDKPLRQGNTRSINPDPNPKIGFLDASTTEKYIYLTYSGKYFNKNHNDAFLSNTVYVFDWQGNPVKRYLLDKPVRSISVDDNENVMYASTYNDGIPSLIKFNLKQ